MLRLLCLYVQVVIAGNRWAISGHTSLQPVYLSAEAAALKAAWLAAVDQPEACRDASAAEAEAFMAADTRCLQACTCLTDQHDLV